MDSSGKRDRSRSSALSFDDLIDELLTEILIRLPPDSVHRCKSVSKRLLSLISSPQFNRQCILCRPIVCEEAIIFQRCKFSGGKYITDVEAIATPKRSPPSNSIKFPLPSLHIQSTTLKLVGCCNGLVLFSSIKLFFCVYNPFTGQSVQLPPLPDLKPPERLDGGHIGFICDNYFDKVVEEEYPKIIPNYKVVLISQLQHSIKIICFCSEKGNWDVFDVICPERLKKKTKFTSMVIYNGMFHWLSMVGIVVYDIYNNPNQFDYFIDLPKAEYGNKLFSVQLTANQGQIRMGYFNYIDIIDINVWQLDDYRNSLWSLKYKICFRNIMSEIPWNDLKIKIGSYWKKITSFDSKNERKPLSISSCLRNNGVRIVPRFLGFSEMDSDIAYIKVEPQVILSYNMKTNVLQKVFDLGHLGCERGCKNHSIFPFVLPWWPKFSNPDLKPKAT